jgi:RHS repeat-associated protein
MSTVTLPGSGGSVTFRYDPFGRRIYRSSSSGTSIFGYQDYDIVDETNAAGVAVARYTHGPTVDEPLAMLRNGTTSYYEADGLNSITSLTDATGALAQTYTLDSFGNQTASSGSLTNPYRYTGREFDSETGLYYMRARDFDPSSGRFLSEDPLEFMGERNFYRYALNNPTNYVDPTGLNTTVVILYDKGPFGTSFGSHAALLIDNGQDGKPFLYDPAGAFGHDRCKSPAGECSSQDENGDNANAKKYIDFYRSDPSFYGYQLFIFSTTPEQEKQIADRIATFPEAAPGFCSISVSDAISGIGPFKNVKGGTFFPGNLADQLQNILFPLRPKGGHK